jgi:hypothetical protein
MKAREAQKAQEKAAGFLRKRNPAAFGMFLFN